jgi:hypothetical protein
MILQRRSFLTGLFSGIVAAPAIVRAASLMPVRFIQEMPRCELYFDLRLFQLENVRAVAAVAERRVRVM